MKQKRKRKQFILFLVDFILLCLVIYPVLLLRNASIPTFSSLIIHLSDFMPIIFFWVGIQYVEDLYSLEHAYANSITAVKIFSTAVICLLLGFTWFYLVPNSQLTPKTVLLIYCAIASAVLYIWRLLFTVLYLRFSNPLTIGFIGITPVLNDLIDHSKKFSFMGYKIAGIFDDTFEALNYKNIPVYKNFDDYIAFLKTTNISQIVMIQQKDLSAKIQKNLFSLLKSSIQFISITQFYEMYIRKIPLSAINELWFLQHIDLSMQKNYVVIKRFADLIVSSIFLLLTLPFYPLIIGIIKLESKGPAFFTQTRTGFLGQNFTLYKFRTMTVLGNTFAPTEKHDVRITRLGSFLRKTRLDEIPQLLNVILGNMSIIGPRPERPELIIELEEKVPFYKQRLLVRPGITGWDQVSGEYHSPSIEDTYKKLQYDLYYIKNMSVLLDISIVAKTIRTILVRSGR